MSTGSNWLKVIYYNVLRFLRYEKNGRLLAFYTYDEQRENILIHNKKDLVLLIPPTHVFQPKEMKQGAKINPEDTAECVHKYFFKNCLEETIKAHFEKE